MMSSKKLLDLFCGAGGAARGYADAGFVVTGVDIVDQPRYAGASFIRGDALRADMIFDEFDAVHASPPCQNYCWSTARYRRNGKKYLDLIGSVRELLVGSGKPFVIENVPNAPLRHPSFLEGTMFGLNVIRRRLFETNWWLPQPMYLKRKKPVWQPSVLSAGKLLKKSFYCSVAGCGGDGWSCRFADWEVAMGIDWMNREEIKQAIPPAYTEYIGKYLIRLA